LNKKILSVFLLLLAVMATYCFHQLTSRDLPQQTAPDYRSLTVDNSRNIAVSDFSSDRSPHHTSPPGTNLRKDGVIGTSDPSNFDDVLMSDQKVKESETFLDEGDYYLVRGKKVSIRRDPHRMVVKFEEAIFAGLLSTADRPEEQSMALHAALGRVDPEVTFSIERLLDRYRMAIIRVVQKTGETLPRSDIQAFDTSPMVEYAYPLFVAGTKTDKLLLTDEILVRFADNYSEGEVEEFCAENDLSFVRKTRGRLNVYLLRVSDPKSRSPLEVANSISGEKGVVWAEPNFLAEIKLNTSDPLYSQQWHLNNTGSMDADVQAPEAWAVQTGRPTIVIAIIDDGVDLNHEDLEIWNNPGESGSGKEDNGSDDDGNLYPDDYRGWDFYDDDNDPGHAHVADHHGTACAGLAAAKGDNGVGIAGVAYGCAILPIKIVKWKVNIFNPWEYVEHFTPGVTLGEAIHYAADLADVISCSWVFSESNWIELAIDDAVTKGRDGLGTPVFFATGNHASEGQGIAFPASYANSIAVGASNYSDERASYSQYGGGIDFVAPGGEEETLMITTTLKGSKYTNSFSGTSAATPLAAGIAALMLSKNENLTATQVRAIMRATCDQVGIEPYDNGWNMYYGHGRLNAYKALTFDSGHTRIPYTQDFSLGMPSIADGWEFYSSTEDGRIRVATNGRLRLESSHCPLPAVEPALNEAILTLPLEGFRNVRLEFFQAQYDQHNDPLPETFTDHENGDGISISNDGTTWYRILDASDLAVGSSGQVFNVDLDAELEDIQDNYDPSFTYSSSFMIKIQQYDDSHCVSDGREWDDISVTGEFVSITVPENAWESDGALQDKGTASVGKALASDLHVVLFSSDTSAVEVPSQVIIPAGETSATFDLNLVDDFLLDGTQTVTVTASAPGYPSAIDTIQVNDNETAGLTLEVPDSAAEGEDVVAKITVSRKVDADVVVSMSSGDTSEVKVPESVVIAAGQSSTMFDLEIVDDDEIDGTQAATITASVTGWESGSDTLEVNDNEDTFLTVTVPEIAGEGDGVLENGGLVSLSGTVVEPLIVNLSSDDTSEVTVPATVTVLQGQASATFNLDIENDDDYDGMQIATVTATAAGFTDGSDTITVADDDVHHFAVSTVSEPLVAGGPLSITITAQDINGATITSFTGTVDLNATGDSGTLLVEPSITGVFIDGKWTGNVTVNTSDTNVILTVGDGLGHTGASNVFQVQTGPLDHFSFVTISSPQYENTPFSVTITAKDSVENTVTDFTDTVNLSGWSASLTSLFSDGFEDEDLSGWIEGSGSYVREVRDESAASGDYSLTLVGGSGGHRDGVSHSLSSLRPKEVQFYIRSSSTSRDDGYFVVDGDRGGFWLYPAVWFFCKADGTMGLSVGNRWYARPYNANQWYKIALVFDWPSKQVDYLVDDSIVETDIPFMYNVDNLRRLYLYNYDDSQAWWDEIRFLELTKSGVTMLPISSTSISNFDSGIWSGEITVLDESKYCYLKAAPSDGDGPTGESNIFEVRTLLTLILSIPPSATEGDGVLTGQGTVSVSAPLIVDLTINLKSDDTTEGTVPGTITIYAGQTAATFDLTVVNDELHDGTQTTTITASATGYTSTSDTIQVAEDDRDGDGLPGDLEKMTSTDPNDADTDDDGIPDGLEDTNHNGVVDAMETDPCNRDTDGDGIQDGTELGYTLADIGGYTNSNVFQQDLDFSTTTDPLKPDSDNDGLKDGQEDVDMNGLIDQGETDPSNADTDNDQMPDGWEVTFSLLPLVDDALADADGDGYANIEEYRRSTDPTDPSSYPSKAMPWIPLLLLED
jgi:subtilisin family serine protease